MREIGVRLMDAVEHALVAQAEAAMTEVEGVVDVADLRIRWIGHTLRAEVDLLVTPTLSLTEAHEVAHHVEAHLLARVPRLTAATVHASPAGATDRGRNDLASTASAESADLKPVQL